MMSTDIHVVGAVIVDDGKILCAQRGTGKSLPLFWEFPGGKIEPEESPSAALERELMEEMHCEITVGDKVDYTIYEYDFGVVHLTTFLCKIVKGKPVLTEHKAMTWLSPHELPTLDWAPADIPAIEKLIKMVF